MAGDRSLKCFRSCSLPFLLSPLLICWGLCVLSISLVTLVVTSSYRGVFPFGAPLWTGTLFLITGCFLVFAYKASESLALTSKAHVWFTISLGILMTCESLLALALSLWYYLVVSPILSLCSPDPSLRGGAGTICECTPGFINPPSLMRTVLRFEGVTDCNKLGGTLQVFYNILTGLYALGVVLSLVLLIGACKKLHSLGVFGESGVYTITPATSVPAASRQGSPDVATGTTHSSAATVTGQYNFSSGQSTITSTVPHRFTGTPSYLMSRRRTAVVTATATGGRTRLASTGSIYQSAMI